MDHHELFVVQAQERCDCELGWSLKMEGDPLYPGSLEPTHVSDEEADRVCPLCHLFLICCSSPSQTPVCLLHDPHPSAASSHGCGLHAINVIQGPEISLPTPTSHSPLSHACFNPSHLSHTSSTVNFEERKKIGSLSVSTS